MESTLKVANDSYTGKPVIKIITPQLDPTTNPWLLDEDVKDQLIREFLHHPNWSEPYEFYQKGCQFNIPNTNKRIVTIEPVEENNIFYRFRHALLNRFVPYDTLVELNRIKQKIESGEIKTTQGGQLTRKEYCAEDLANKINEFFDWIEGLEYATDEQRYPAVRQF